MTMKTAIMTEKSPTRKKRAQTKTKKVHPRPDEDLVKEYERSVLKSDIEMQMLSRAADQYRGVSITVGSTGGDGLEVCIRMQNGHTSFMPLSHHHAVELAHQIAAQAGCLIAIKPREDFASHRLWNNEKPMLGAAFGANMLGVDSASSENLMLPKNDAAVGEGKEVDLIKEQEDKLQYTINNDYIDGLDDN